MPARQWTTWLPPQSDPHRRAGRCCRRRRRHLHIVSAWDHVGGFDSLFLSPLCKERRERVHRKPSSWAARTDSCGWRVANALIIQFLVPTPLLHHAPNCDAENASRRTTVNRTHFSFGKWELQAFPLIETAFRILERAPTVSFSTLLTLADRRPRPKTTTTTHATPQHEPHPSTAKNQNNADIIFAPPSSLSSSLP
jgi:hypothetical protein